MIDAYYQEGQAAFGRPFDCPYRSGQQVYGWWNDGYVDAAVDADTMPLDAPLYVQGRIAYGLGQTIDEKPAGEECSGRWVSGWLHERERKQHQRA